MAWTRRPSDALTGEFVPQQWSSRVINHVRSNLVSLNLVNISWRDQLTIGDKLWIPVMLELTGGDVDVTTDGVMDNMNTTAGTTVASVEIDTWKEVPVQIDDSVKGQTQVGDLLGTMADNAAYRLEKYIDADVHGMFSSLNSSLAVYGSDGQTFTDDMLIAMMQALDELDVPRDNRSLIGDPSVLADIYVIDKFMSYDYSQRPMGFENIQQGGQGGYRGMIQAYQLPVYITNNLTDAGTGNVGCLLHRDAIGLIVQSGPDVEKWREPKRHSDIVNISAMWGCDELRDTFGYAFYTRSD